MIHRDLKPANILVEEGDQPKILDFGIARLIAGDMPTASIQTGTGQLVGTLPYMSPEQVSGASRALDKRSDIYSLGVILYELLSGTLPHDLQDLPITEAARVILEEDPPSLQSLDTLLRGDVQTIVHKAMAKERSRRYASAAVLASDLRAFLRGEPISARPASRIYHLSKFVRRHKAVFLGGTMALLSLLLALGFMTAAYWRETEAHAAEARARNLAEKKTTDAERSAYHALLAGATSALRASNVSEAQRLLENAGSSPFRGWEWEHLHAGLDQSSHRLDPKLFPTRFVAAESDLHVSSDGWVQFTPESLGDGKEISAWNPETDEQHARRIETAGLMVAGPDGLRLAFYSHREETLVIEETRTGRRLSETDLRQVESRPAPWCGDERKSETRIRVQSVEGFWLISDSKKGNRRLMPFGRVLDSGDDHACFVSDGRGTRFGVNAWGLEQLWELSTGRAVGPVPERPDPKAVEGFLAPDHETIVTYLRRTPHLLWAHLENSKPVHWSEIPTVAAVGSIDFSRAGDRAAVALTNGVISLLDTRSFRALGSLLGHTTSVSRVRFDPQGSRLASLSSNGDARLWDLEDSQKLTVLGGHSSYVYPVAFSPDGMRIVSASWDRTVCFWDAESSELIAQVVLPLNRYNPGSLTYLDARRLLLTGRQGFGPQRHFILDTRTGAIERWLDAPGYTHWGVEPDSAVDARQGRAFIADLRSVSVWDVRGFEPPPRTFPTGGGVALSTRGARRFSRHERL